MGQQDFGGEARDGSGGVFQQACALEQRFTYREHGRSRSGGFAFISEPSGLVVSGERADDRVQASFHYLIELVESKADAMVGDAVLREVVGADLFAAVAAAHHATAL